MDFKEGKSKRFYQYGEVHLEIPFIETAMGEDWDFDWDYRYDTKLPKIISFCKNSSGLNVIFKVRRKLAKKSVGLNKKHRKAKVSCIKGRFSCLEMA
jgi:hypothetical protein